MERPSVFLWEFELSFLFNVISSLVRSSSLKHISTLWSRQATPFECNDCNYVITLVQSKVTTVFCNNSQSSTAAVIFICY